MKIGVVSDTHSNQVPAQLLADFKDVDLIIHAGDFCTVSDYEVFKKLKEVKAVYGNMDDSGVRKIFPRREIIKIDDVAIGLFHGEGSPRTIVEVVESEFKDDDVDVIVFGHSHQPLNESINGVLYFNPGSPTDTVFAPYCSYGILNIANGKATGKIIKVK